MTGHRDPCAVRCPRERGHASRAKRDTNNPPVTFHANKTLVTRKHDFNNPPVALSENEALVTDEQNTQVTVACDRTRRERGRIANSSRLRAGFASVSAVGKTASLNTVNGESCERHRLAFRQRVNHLHLGGSK